VSPRVGHRVGLADRAVGPDEERETFGEGRVLLVGSLLRPVGTTRGVVRIGQEAVRERLRLGEGQVLLGCVERDAKDLGVGLGEFGGSITEPLSLAGSAGRRRLRVPPQHDPPPPQVGQLHRPAMLVEQREVGSLYAGLEHGPELT
jgi:hypothetical protein